LEYDRQRTAAFLPSSRLRIYSNVKEHGGHKPAFPRRGTRPSCCPDYPLDSPNQHDSAYEISFYAHAPARCFGPDARRERGKIDQTGGPRWRPR